MKDIKLINAYDLAEVINKDRIELNTHEDSKCRSVHNGEYTHFLKRILEAEEVFNVKEICDRIVNELLKEKQYELYGMYNGQTERMIAEYKMEWKNEIIDECIDIVKREFGT